MGYIFVHRWIGYEIISTLLGPTAEFPPKARTKQDVTQVARNTYMCIQVDVGHFKRYFIGTYHLF
jgi:hypothetical protein